MLIKPEKVLKNEAHLLEIVELLLKLKATITKKFPDASAEDRQWAMEQAILRLSLNDGVDFGTM